MIRAQRRWTTDVGTCQGCDQPNTTRTEVNCIGVMRDGHGVELRVCDTCLAEFLATVVRTSKMPARATRSIVGSAPDGPQWKQEKSRTPRWMPKTQAKKQRPRKPPKPYPAKKPQVRADTA